jgi:hypothetical protein
MKKRLCQRVKFLNAFDILSALTRMEIDRLNAGSCRPALQSPAVLDVKPAIEDVDVYIFLAFLCTYTLICI